MKTRDRPKHRKTRTLGSNSMKQSTWHCIGNMCSRNGAVAEAVWVSEFLSALLHAAKKNILFSPVLHSLFAKVPALGHSRLVCLFSLADSGCREELHLRKSSFKYSTGVIMNDHELNPSTQ